MVMLNLFTHQIKKPNINLSEKFTLEKYGRASQSLGNLNNCVR
jgi:hypothetical protein